MIQPSPLPEAIGTTLIIAALQGFMTTPTLAYDIGLFRVEHSGTTVTLGAGFRASGRDPDLMPAPSASAMGSFGRAPGGQNSDDGNLNFNRGDRTSTVLKAFTGLNIGYGDSVIARVRVKAWHDFTLGEQNVPWGNLPNGYSVNAPLSDGGFNRLAKFSGISLTDAHVEINSDDRSAVMKLGKQTIAWGNPNPAITIRGGLEQVNAVDIPASQRPGAIAQEYLIPATAAFAKFDLIPKRLTAEGFYQFQFQPNQIPGCGTFNSHVDYAAAGCDKVVVGTVNDRLALTSGLFSKRGPDRDPSNGGQFGLALNYTNPDIGRFGVYYANIHSRRWVPSAIKSSRAGVPLIPGDPGNANVRYFIEYPEDTRIWGLNYGFTKDGSALYAELTHQPNQPIRLNGTDLLNAFASNVAPTLLRADATATAPGAAYHGYDRFKITQLTISGRKPLGNLAGAGEFIFSGEAGYKHVHDLPDLAVRRYGRGDPFGIGPIAGTCTGNSVQCSNAGFVTANSWGYRMRGDLLMREVAPGVSLTPSLSFGHDVKGWSHDEDFSEKRKAMIAALRADHKNGYFAEIRWTSYWGGTYNINRDRDVVFVVVGMTMAPSKRDGVK